MDSLCRQVLETVRRHDLLGGARRAVLAVSGGPDSLAMLHVMAALQRAQFPGLELTAAHLHHGMRGAEADADAAFVRDQAEGLGLPCRVGHADIPAIAAARGYTEETAGREARYRFLGETARATGADRVLTAHHADDQVETVLMRVMRGAGARGLAGIPIRRPLSEDLRNVEVIRPLIACRRGEIESFLRHRGLSGRLDRTNLSPDYLRNRVRHRLRPALEGRWPGDLHTHVMRLSDAARGLVHAHERLGRTLTAQHDVRIEPGLAATEADWLRGLPASLIAELIEDWAQQAGLRGRQFDRTHYEQAAALAVGGEEGALTLPGGVIVRREGDALILHRAETPEFDQFEAQINVPGETAIEPLGAALCAEVLPRDALAAQPWREKTDDEEYLDREAAGDPLAVRFPRAGDRMRPLGAPGTQSVADILTNAKAPQWAKRRTPVVTSGGDPIWIVGHRIAERVKLQPQTQTVLLLRLRRR